jgi:dTDP-4-dehydrorhamnose 3,5-epimerase
MTFEPTALPEVVRIVPRVHEDARGFFLESWNARAFAAAGYPLAFVQDNHSRSTRGTLRGLHYQVGADAQGKLVRVVVGEVFDVAVDLRRGSPTRGRWVGERLSAANRRMLWIPPGFAHGFYVVSEAAELLYKCTALYAPAAERTVAWNDPDLAIGWPLVDGEPPVVSVKDAAGTPFARAETVEC